MDKVQHVGRLNRRQLGAFRKPRPASMSSIRELLRQWRLVGKLSLGHRRQLTLAVNASIWPLVVSL